MKQDVSWRRGKNIQIAGRMLEPGMRDEEQKGRKIRKAMVGGGGLKGGWWRGGVGWNDVLLRAGQHEGGASDPTSPNMSEVFLHLPKVFLAAHW